MFLTLLCSAAPALTPTAPPPALSPSPPSLVQDEARKEIEAAGEDVAKLLALAQAWKDAGREAQAKAAYERILEIDPEHAEAHKALRHHLYDGKWFKSYAELSKYRRAEKKKMEAKGFSRLGDRWVPTADLPYLRMGWKKDEAGVWYSPAEAARAAEAEKHLAAGDQLRKEDSTWVARDELQKWTDGLWKCGDEWKTKEEANAYHAHRATWWQAIGEHFDIDSTCDLDTLLWIRWHADQTYGDLVRLFGVEPRRHPLVVVFPSIEEFNAFAAGGDSVPPAEQAGFSSLHYAYFADSWVEMNEGFVTYKGTGVGYWDTSDPNLAPYGKHSVRHAAGLAYAEAIDPSWLAISEMIASQAPADPAAFWAEKKIPRWLRYGGASYVERYYRDPEAENPWWPREWALQNLPGDLDPLETIFAFGLSLEDIPGSTRLIHESGLLVSFLLDGGSPPVEEAHQAFRAALRKGEGTAEAVQALQQALLDNEKALRAYAGK